MSCHLDQALAHRLVQPQWRVGVDQRDDPGFVDHLLVADTARDLVHDDAVAAAFRTQGIGPPHPVGLGNEGHVAIKVTGRHRQVDRLDRIAT